MCYIFNCFGWALDFLQRAVTFCLACVLSCIVTIGLIVAIAAGIAYGYNYSMAEFLTFTRQDVTVYMRRGQFYDKPEIDMDQNRDSFSARRSGDEEDLFGMNKTIDYEDTNLKAHAKALPDSWGQVKDSRKYAEVLTKYSSNKDGEQSIQNPINTGPPTTASPIVPTTLLQSGTSKIVMRKFQTVNIISYLDTTTMHRHDHYFYQEPEEIPDKSTEEPKAPTRTPSAAPTRTLLRKFFEDINRATQYIPMRHWDTTKKREVQDELYADDVDEDNLVYKMKSV